MQSKSPFFRDYGSTTDYSSPFFDDLDVSRPSNRYSTAGLDKQRQGRATKKRRSEMPLVYTELRETTGSLSKEVSQAHRSSITNHNSTSHYTLKPKSIFRNRLKKQVRVSGISNQPLRHSFLTNLELAGSSYFWAILTIPLFAVLIFGLCTNSWRNESISISYAECASTNPTTDNSLRCSPETSSLEYSLPKSINQLGFVRTMMILDAFNCSMDEWEDSFISFQAAIQNTEFNASVHRSLLSAVLYPKKALQSSYDVRVSGDTVYLESSTIMLPLPWMELNMPGVASGSVRRVSVNISLLHSEFPLEHSAWLTQGIFIATYEHDRFTVALAVLSLVLSICTAVIFSVIAQDIILHASNLSAKFNAEGDRVAAAFSSNSYNRQIADPAAAPTLSNPAPTTSTSSSTAMVMVQQQLQQKQHIFFDRFTGERRHTWVLDWMLPEQLSALALLAFLLPWQGPLRSISVLLSLSGHDLSDSLLLCVALSEGIACYGKHTLAGFILFKFLNLEGLGFSIFLYCYRTLGGLGTRNFSDDTSVHLLSPEK